MSNAHERHGALTPVGRTQPGVPGRGVLARPYGPGRSRRGFSMVELAVSLTIFLTLASAISLAVARSLSAATSLRTQTQSAGALSDELGKLAGVPYADLLAGTFHVPDACPGTPTGIGGDSCVKVGTQRMRIGYGFQTTAGDFTCATTDAHKYAATYGYVTVNGCVIAVGRNAFSATGVVAGSALPTQSQQVNAPRPGFKPGAGSVRVQLSGRYTDLPGRMVLLIHPPTAAHPAIQVGSGTVDDSGAVTIPVDAGECTADNVCALALSVGATPTEAFGGGTTLALVDTTAAGAGAGFTVTADQVVQTSARVSAVASATFDLVALKSGVRTPNPVPGSVCLWVSFPDTRQQRAVPVCNTTTAGRITIDTYEPGWASFSTADASTLSAALASSDTRARYPFPAGTTLRLSVDSPDGRCPYAPGMVGSRPGDTSGVAGAPANWSPLAVCTSFTWGAPSRLELRTATGTTSQGFTPTGTPITLDPNAPLSGSVVWDNPLLAPGAVGYGADPAWDKPRTALGCSADESCTSTLGGLASAVADPATGFPTPSYPNASCVADGSCREAVDRVGPEAGECPGEYCYSTVNSKAYLLSPATHTVQLSSTGTTTTFTLDVRDTDDDAATISVALAAGSPPNGLSFTLGSPTTVDAHTQRWPVTVVDSTGTTDLKVVTLALTSGSGARAQTSQVDLGLYYNGGAWQLTGDPVSAAQGATNVPVRVHVTGTDGAAYAGASVDFTATAGGVAITSAVSDSSGYATGVMTVPVGTSAGSYTIRASVSGTGRSVSIPLTVTGTAGALSVAVDSPTLNEGARSTIRAQVSDGASGPVAGAVVNLVVTADGVPSSSVYPASAGFVTASDGTCSVPLVVDADAPAGAYTLGATSGTLAATPANVTVTAVPASARFALTPNVAQGQSLPAAPLVILDGAGNPVPNVAVSVSAAAATGLSVSPASGTTDVDGTFPVGMTAAADAPTGTATLTATVAGKAFPVPVTVSPTYGGITATATSIDQGGSGAMTVTVLSGSSSPVPGAPVVFSVDTPGISLSPQATTDANGQATTVIDVGNAVRAGSYPLTVSVSGTTSTFTLTIAPVPTSVTASGAVSQGETSPVTLSVYDMTGAPIPGQSLSVTGAPATFSLASPTVSTDSSGAATLSVTDSGTPAGTQTLTVTAGPLTTAVPVNVLAVPGRIDFGGLTEARLSTAAPTTVPVTVYDRAGQPYPGASVQMLGLPAGASVSPASATSDATGKATFALTADDTMLGGRYASLVQADQMTASLPTLAIGAYTQAELNDGASLLLPLDDSDLTARDVAGDHPGSYVPGDQSWSIQMRQDSALTGSDAVAFQPMDATGTFSATAHGEIQVPDAAGTALPATGSFSISAWLKPTSVAGSRSAFPLTKGAPDASTPGLALGGANSGTSLRVTLSDGAHLVDAFVPLDAGYQPTDWVGSWTHVVLVVDRGAGVARVYVNGVAQSATVDLTSLTGSLSNTANLVFGTSSGFDFDGLTDELAVFPSALSAGQVAGLHSAGLTTNGFTLATLAQGPVGYWTLGDATGPSVHATVGTDGTSNGATLGQPGVVAGATTTGFAGTGADANVPTGTLAGASAYSAALWFYPTAASVTPADGVLVGANLSDPALTWGTGTTAGSTQAQMQWGYTDGLTPATGALSSSALTLNAWHQLAYTVAGPAGGQTLTLYVDGSPAGSVTLTRPIGALGTAAYLAANGASTSLPGRLGQVELFDRALNAADVSTAYATARRYPGP